MIYDHLKSSVQYIVLRYTKMFNSRFANSSFELLATASGICDLYPAPSEVSNTQAGKNSDWFYRYKTILNVRYVQNGSQ